MYRNCTGLVGAENSYAGIPSKGYRRIIKTQVGRNTQVSYLNEAKNPQRVENFEMLRLFRGRTLQHKPIGISPDCKVSLSQDGAVFLHTARGIVYTSNGIGARIWQGLQDRQSVDEISAKIGRDYGVPGERVRQDAVHFLAELETQGFLSPTMGR